MKLKHKDGHYIRSWRLNYMRWACVLMLVILVCNVPVVTSGMDTTTENSLSPVSLMVNSALTPHGPITITHDDNFTQLGFDGLGTEAEPYIIENLDIFQSTKDGNCIEINNTRAFFVIEGCYLNGTDNWASIFLNNVSNGIVRDNICEGAFNSIIALDLSGSLIERNECIATFEAILLEDSTQNIVRNNIIKGDGNGIHLEQADNNTIEDNTITEFWQIGIFLYGVNNVIDNNTISGGQRGIWIISVNNTITGNRMYSCGLALGNSVSEQTLVEGNSVNDKPSIYHQYEDGVTIPTNAGEVHLIDCDNIIIEDLIINGTTRGIALSECENVTIRNNSISYTNLDAIDLDFCYVVNITGNYLFGGFMGMDLYPAYTGFISQNYATGFHTPLMMSGSGFTIEWNSFLGVHQDANDRNGGNSFDYNYYSEYDGVDVDNNGVGDSSFTVPGNAGTMDLHPLMYIPTPPSWTMMGNITHEYGKHLEVSLELVSASPLADWSINDTAHFSFDGELIRNMTGLAIGDYPILVTIENMYDYSLEQEITIIVMDTIPPTLEVQEVYIFEAGQSISIDLNISDASGIASILLNDTSVFEVSDTGILTGNSPPVWHYKLGVMVSDTSGHNTSAEFVIIVQDTIVPVVVPPPNDLTYVVGETGNVIIWEVSDLNPLSYSIEVNDSVVKEGSWTSGSIFIYVDNLSSGTYACTLFITDTGGNSVSSTVYVHVNEPVTQILSLTIVLGSIGIVIVVTVLFLRRR